MLEVFQDLSNAPPEGEGGAEVDSSHGQGSGQAGSSTPGDPRFALEVGACIVAFALGVFTHSMLTGPADAVSAAPGADSQLQDLSEQPPSPPAAAAPGEGIEQRAPGAATSGRRVDLHDPAKPYVILAITYGKGKDLQAHETYRYLSGRGLPAFEPVDTGTNIVVLVGAAAKQAGLAQTLTQLRATPGPSGRRGEFESALVMPKRSFGLP